MVWGQGYTRPVGVLAGQSTTPANWFNLVKFGDIGMVALKKVHGLIRLRYQSGGAGMCLDCYKSLLIVIQWNI